MRFRMNLLSVVLFMVPLCPMAATSQVTTGIYDFGAFDSKDFDTINIGNLNSHFEIPVFSKPGRGGLNFSHSLVYDSAVWTLLGESGSQFWHPMPQWGWGADAGSMTGNLSFSTAPHLRCTDTTPFTYLSTQGNFVYTDWNGKVHSFYLEAGDDLGPIVANGTCSSYDYLSTSGSWQASDNSGIILVAFGYNNYKIQFPNGQVVRPLYNSAASTTTASDPNGNSITSTGTTFTDTTGNTVLTLSGQGTPSSPRLLTYPTYVNGGAGTAAVTVNYVSYSVQTAFGCSGITEYHSSAVNLVDNIVLADGQTYSFTYEPTPGVSGSVTGRMASVRLPGGGHINYAYSGGNNGIVCQDGGTATLARSMPDDPAGSSWTYTRTPGASGAANSHTEVVDSSSRHATYDFVNDSTDIYRTPFVVAQNKYSGSASGTAILAVSTCYNGASTCIGQSVSLPILSLAVTTTLDGTSVKKSTQTYNSYGLLTNQTDYDFSSGAPGGQVRAVAITYASLGNGIVDRPSEIVVRGSSNSVIQKTEYSYDEVATVATSGLPHHTSVSGSRGNLSSVWVPLNGLNEINTASSSYDDAGQLKTSTDAWSNQTTYTYESTGTFATSVSMPTTGGVAHSTGATYDVPSGLQLSSVDLKGNFTYYTYDSMLRTLAVTKPASAVNSYSYSLASSSPYTTSSVLHSGNSYISTTTRLDGYGRVSQTEQTDTPSNDLVSYSYNANGLVSAVSNPYRTGDTPVYTRTTYDALGRAVTVQDSDGVSQSTYTYLGNTTTVSDEAAKQRRIVTDAEGRTAQVFEPDSSNSLTLETDYQYDQTQAHGIGTLVTQKGGSSSGWRVRTFTYDPLGRMVFSSTPEAKNITYTYPVNGSLCAANLSLPCTRTDANGTTTTYAYDALSRLTGKTYSGSTIATNTPSVSYTYDQANYNGLTITNSNGLLTGMSDGSGTTAWSYDGLGNVTAVRKTVNRVTKEADYTYNADSTTNTVTDFGGTRFTYAYDIAGRPTQVADGLGNTYAASAIYNASGQLTSLNHQLTSGGGRYVRSWQYNSRMQPSIISATLNNNTIQSLSYGYGANGTNNGNIMNIENGMASSRNQTFSYDNLNRLQSAKDTSNWGETYTYDNWGNLYQTTRMNGYSGGNNWSLTPPGTSNQLSNQTYDSAGEVTTDQYSNAYSYDAEGRLLSAGGGAYVYDGAGNRVKKTVGSNVTLYWPGAGALLDESDSSGTTMAKQVPFAGLLVWSESVSAGGRFLFQDHLGSTRVTGDASGNLGDDIDYLPFGSIAGNYGSASANHYTFTGYESDQSESSTDYAIFRNLSTSMGRFNRPDPYDGSYDLTNPQSLNRYAYVLNNPLRYIDPYGLESACYWDADNVWDDTPYNGGATEAECNAQGGTWKKVDGPTVTATVNGDNPGAFYIVILIGGHYYSSYASSFRGGGRGSGGASSASSNGNDMKYDIFHCPSCVNTWKQANCVVSKPLEQASGISAVGVATSSLRSGINQAEGWSELLSATYNGAKSRLLSAGAAISTYAATIGLTAYYTVAGCK